MKVLGIDYGTKRIGLAISDGLKMISVPIDTIEAKKKLADTVTYLKEYLKERLDGIESIVIGLPLHLNGKESDMSKVVREFGSALEIELEKKVFFFDERLSSKQVDGDLRRLGLKRKKRKKHLDCGSACLVLQSF